MRKGETLNHTAIGQNLTLGKGKFVVNAGKRLPWMELEITVPVKNTTGGNLTLTNAQVLAFIATLSLTLRHGQAKVRKIFDGLTFDILRQISRERLGCDWPQLFDTAVGMRQTIANGATTNCTFFAQIPLGYDWLDDSIKDLAGVGPYQASTMSMDMKRGVGGTDGLPANVSVDVGGIVSTIVYPEQPARFEQWENIPEYREQDESSGVATLSDVGLTHSLWEKSATSAASLLTSMQVSVAGDLYHDSVSAQEIATQYTSDPELPAAATVSDTFTLLLAYNSRNRFREKLPGQVQVKQVNKVLATAHYGQYYTPLLAEDDVLAEMTEAAKSLKREVRCVSIAEAAGANEIPETHKAFVGFALMTAADADAKRLNGIVSTPSSPAHPYVNSTQAAILKSRVATDKASGNLSGAAYEVAKVAASIPGGNTNPPAFRATGLGQPSRAYDAVRQAAGL